jgi:hypothetical protein
MTNKQFMIQSCYPENIYRSSSLLSFIGLKSNGEFSPLGVFRHAVTDIFSTKGDQIGAQGTENVPLFAPWHWSECHFLDESRKAGVKLVCVLQLWKDGSLYTRG